MDNLKSLINLLQSSIQILKHELDGVKTTQSEQVATHTDRFLGPYIQRLEGALLIVTSAARAKGDPSSAIKVARDTFLKADNAILARLEGKLTGDAQNAFDQLLGVDVGIVGESTEEAAPSATKKSFSLLQTIAGLQEAVADVSDGTRKAAKNPNMVSVPASVKKDIADKLAEMKQCLDDQKKFAGKTDYAVKLVGEPFPADDRIRRGTDGVIGLLEWLSEAFANEISYDDLKTVVIKFNTYGNVIRQHVPASTVKFLYACGKWKEWQEKIAPEGKSHDVAKQWAAVGSRDR